MKLEMPADAGLRLHAMITAHNTDLNEFDISGVTISGSEVEDNNKERVKHKRKIIKLHQRRLDKLDEQKALFGPRTPPEILIEIEDTTITLEKLNIELEILETN